MLDRGGMVVGIRGPEAHVERAEFADSDPMSVEERLCQIDLSVAPISVGRAGHGLHVEN